MAISKYASPPKSGTPEFEDFMLELYHNFYNLASGQPGTVNNDNGALGTDSTTDAITEGEDNLFHTPARVNDVIEGGNALTKTYDSDVVTLDVDKVTDPTDVATTITGSADLTYSANEQSMLNQAAADIPALETKINEILANMRSANHM